MYKLLSIIMLTAPHWNKHLLSQTISIIIHHPRWSIPLLQEPWELSCFGPCRVHASEDQENRCCDACTWVLIQHFHTTFFNKLNDLWEELNYMGPTQVIRLLIGVNLHEIESCLTNHYIIFFSLDSQLVVRYDSISCIPLTWLSLTLIPPFQHY